MRNCQCCKSLIENYIYKLTITPINEINLNNELKIKYCKECYFYFVDSNNNQDDYNEYYLKFNSYKDTNNKTNNDKDEKCFNYLINNLDKNIKNILDYGCGNKILSNFLNKIYNVDIFDIDMEKNEKKYDCVILSHVLEHIYDIQSFINLLKINIKEDGYLYIEVPNMEYYDKFNIFGPLQEISIEHINFFSKYSLSKLMVNHGFIPTQIIDDYFTINSNKYYIIRGIFKLNRNNNSFNNYLEDGVQYINNIKIKNKKLYLYGCGQFLFKIFNYLNENNFIINIIDDNICNLNKNIKNINIINFEMYKNIAKDDDNILITTLNYKDIIINKINLLNKNINILNF